MNPADRMTIRAFGEFISQARLRLNWGWYKASSQTGLSHIRIQSLERGTSHRAVTTGECEAFAKAYGLTLSNLLKIASGEMEVA